MKKGLSTVIATLIIILLVIVGVCIIYAVIKDVIKPKILCIQEEDILQNKSSFIIDIPEYPDFCESLNNCNASIQLYDENETHWIYNTTVCKEVLE